MKEIAEYETPLVQIRGVFLCENLAAPISVWTGTIKQEEWGSGEVPVGDGTHIDGDVWVDLD
jgi:hypothetical protein